MSVPVSATKEKKVCYHCGLDCNSTKISVGEKIFCCNGCKMVFELLAANDLGQYYDLNKTPGTTPPPEGTTEKFGYLDDASFQQQLLHLSDGKRATVVLYIPNLHCSACIWLLESLYKMEPGILRSRVNFLRKTVSITFDQEQLSLRKVVERLASIGYEPRISPEDIQPEKDRKSRRGLYLKIGIAGFGFANIMLFSLPEYFAGPGKIPPEFTRFFGILNILLALPVFFYSSWDYFRSAWYSLKSRSVNMDVPIAMGIITLFSRSIFEIVTRHGPGWLDSFSGLVFLLLLGKLFQEKTYQTLSFERDYKSYFPVSVIRVSGEKEKSVPLSRLRIGDRILIRNNEIVPADSVLIRGKGRIDYSFVTGESETVTKVSGDLIFAGGRQEGSAIELEVVRDVSQSYLTQLWNSDAFKKQGGAGITSLANQISKYFTAIVIIIASLAGLYWLFVNPEHALNAFTAVLIIACPCALALATPFTLGNVLRIFGRNRLFMKNSTAVEQLSRVDTILLDKTGTLTDTKKINVTFIPAPDKQPLSRDELCLIKTVVRHSTHPHSRRIYASIEPAVYDGILKRFEEFPGKGIEAEVSGHTLRIGSAGFVKGEGNEPIDPGSAVYIAIDGELKGHFRLNIQYRKGYTRLLKRLGERYKLLLVSGDNDRGKKILEPFFAGEGAMFFNQTPFDKLKLVESLQRSGRRVMMVGDGLNDAGALKQSDIGITISEDVNSFFPACDGILDAGSFSLLPRFLQCSSYGMRIIRVSFVISFLYNAIGLGFAVQGILSPLISAILMPLSSISVVVFTTVSTNLIAGKLGLKGYYGFKTNNS